MEEFSPVEIVLVKEIQKLKAELKEETIKRKQVEQAFLERKLRMDAQIKWHERQLKEATEALVSIKFCLEDMGDMHEVSTNPYYKQVYEQAYAEARRISRSLNLPPTDGSTVGEEAPPPWKAPDDLKWI